MLNSRLRVTLLAACVLLASHVLIAQDVVHAVTGTVNNIDATAKTITVTTDDGSSGNFDQMVNLHKSAGLEKALRNGAVAADGFNQNGAHVIVYYLGWGNPRTAIAFQTLGAGPFTMTDGAVVKFEKSSHLLSIKEPSGAVDSFKMAPETVAETGIGAVEGLKFDLAKGQRVRVTSSQMAGSDTAVFIYAAFAN
jgi:hypothetical protein